MNDNPVRRRRAAWALIGLAGMVVIALVLLSVRQQPAPNALEILGQPVPADHPIGPCYECHKGMSKWSQIEGRATPDGHPSLSCAQCHEGYDSKKVRGASTASAGG